MMLPRTLLVLALAASSLAWGEPLDSPGRIARLDYVEGQVTFHAAQERATTALPDRPLIPGDRLVTEAGGRAELALGTATVRLDERSELSISILDATTVRVELNHGTVSVHLRELFQDEKFVIATPNTTLTFREPGEYRIAVPTEGTTDLTVRGGSVDAVTAGGPVRVAEGQRVRLEGRQALANLVTPQSADAFDDWVLEREVQLANLEPSSEQLAGGDEYKELNSYGEWHDEPSYGRVWMPSYAYGGYDPFRYGYWQNYGMGRTWVNSIPWGYYTFHSGRWAYLNHLNRWCWVPEHRDHPRQFAGDTRPFGHPRGNARERVERAAPRTADRQSNAGDARQPVVMAASGDRARGGIMTRAGNRERNPSPPVASVPRQSGATMRPSRAESPARAEATSDRSQRKTTFGTHPTP